MPKLTKKFKLENVECSKLNGDRDVRRQPLQAQIMYDEKTGKIKGAYCGKRRGEHGCREYGNCVFLKVE